jgi:hypothetical protein
MRSVVLIHAWLEGMGCEVPCELLAIRESLSEPNRIVYSRCSVIEAPHDLPDGNYRVTFDAFTVPAHKEAGLWMPDETPARPILPRIEKPGRPRTPFRIEETAEILPALRNRIA